MDRLQALYWVCVAVHMALWCVNACRWLYGHLKDP
ncbi:Uncharacterised protein [Pseudomonas fluorescens]|jgi:hypothetical protein|uniref:Uncharacterized protein n=1 Tax=Pseudomonas fluorescens TaxID=294 RepID=A0A448DRB0_PSEFL|nr:Uncharacterised protein [Pseudomonas fluorescens]